MQATRAPPRSQRASRVIAALLAIATTFFIHAMVWHYFRQLKMSRPAAYRLESTPQAMWLAASSFAPCAGLERVLTIAPRTWRAFAPCAGLESMSPWPWV